VISLHRTFPPVLSRHFLPAILFLLFATGQAYAATPGDSLAKPGATVSDGPHAWDTVWSDTKALFTEGALIYTAPLRFGARGWLLTGGALAGTGLTMLADESMRREFMEEHNTTKDAVTDLGNLYGTGLPGAVVIVGLYGGGLIFDSPKIRLAGRHVVQSLAYAGLLTTGLKMVIGRHRPYLNDGNQAFDPFTGNDAYFSMPSGHTTVAFAISSSLAADIDNPYATVGLYTVAALTAASRIYVDRHWLSDTFLGAAIGTACGYGVVHLHDAEWGNESSLYVLPTLDGIMVVGRF
jgi:membrane-associated phospholipid phosphatase